MKKQLTALSIIGNIALTGGLLWMRAEHQDDLRALALAAMHGDEIHLAVHARSLAALEADDPEETKAFTDILRKLVAGGERNIEARDRAGLKR
jgi:hypothetical protein